MNEIEEFLKRAAAMRAQQAQQRAQRPPQRAPSVPATPVVYVPEVLDAEVIEADEVSGDDVSNEVRRHLDTGAFQTRATHLAENIRAADDAMESHLHSSFEHRLGDLGASTSAAEDSTLDSEENAAAQALQTSLGNLDIASLLRSPQNIRNAIILCEVLNPPHDRW